MAEDDSAVSMGKSALERCVAERVEDRRPAPVPAERENVRLLRPDAVCLYYPNTQKAPPELRPCALFLTSFQLAIVPVEAGKPAICVPIMSMEDPLPELRAAERGLRLGRDEAAEYRKQLGLGDDGDWSNEEFTVQLEVRSKLPFTWRLVFSAEVESAAKSLTTMVRALRDSYTQKLQSMFAFEHAEQYNKAHAGADLVDGWKIYDVEAELARQVGPPAPEGTDEWAGKGLGTNLRPWFRIAQLDKDVEGQWGGASPTYPARFVVPREATNRLLLEVAKYRSRARIPAVSYVLLQTGATLSRASQPLTGARGARSDADEILLESLLANRYTAGGTPIPTMWSDHSPPSPAAAAQRSGSPPLRSPPPSLSGAPPPLSNVPRGPPPGLSGSTRKSAPAPAWEPKERPAEEKAEKRNRICIFDARSLVAAQANKARGGGFEDTKRNYKTASLIFLNMDNVHGVVRSWKGLQRLLSEHNNNLSQRHRHWAEPERVAKELVPGDGANDHFWSGYDKTNWLLHVQRMLWGAGRIVDEMFLGNSCLVHCSDGWDRTSQLTATAMLCIDPYYRTLHGFAVLVEKEWCTAGHKFAERCGHQVDGITQRAKAGTGNEIEDDEDDDDDSRGKDDGGIAKHTKHGKSQEQSPIFMQWLEGLWQILQQFPQHFEFTAWLLEFLADNLYACLYGTFMCNFDKERVAEGLKDKTVSIWTEVFRIAAAERRGEAPPVLLNPLYSSDAGPAVIRPTSNSKRLRLWESMWLRHECEAGGPAASREAQLLAELAAWRRRAERAEAGLAAQSAG
eukprot:TRINITY_DN17636_c0_g1_i1.p1 TRINITY_DN17636_c0_g1~~TRINITY_DN17636_c0_g1_i1.p1  ORF type:complete len:822 (+),score=251.38 TRINITY_DN17636_c0_g1_i1:86-2467(+)